MSAENGDDVTPVELRAKLRNFLSRCQEIVDDQVKKSRSAGAGINVGASSWSDDDQKWRERELQELKDMRSKIAGLTPEKWRKLHDEVEAELAAERRK